MDSVWILLDTGGSDYFRILGNTLRFEGPFANLSNTLREMEVRHSAH